MMTFNHDGLARLVSVIGLHFLDLPQDALAGQDFAEYNVFLIEVGRENGGDEELASIGTCTT